MGESFKRPERYYQEDLCLLHSQGYIQTHFEDYKKLVRDPKFVCKDCGRVAVAEKNLCNPDQL